MFCKEVTCLCKSSEDIAEFLQPPNTRKLKNVVASKLLGELLTVLGVKRGGEGKSKLKHTNEKGPPVSRETAWLEGTSMGKIVVLDQSVDS